MTDKGLNFLMSVEECRLTAYNDKRYNLDGLTYAIGYGTVFFPKENNKFDRAVKKNDKLKSPDEAFELLKDTVSAVEELVKDTLTDSVYNTLNNNQKDALISFAYSVCLPFDVYKLPAINIDYFSTSTVCKKVKADKDDKTIKEAFIQECKYYIFQKKDPKLTKRRSNEAAMYFGELTEIPNVDAKGSGTTSTSTGIVSQMSYDLGFGNDNMFYELSTSKDWVVTPFKEYPRKSNGWSPLIIGSSCPKVGDLLFAFHDNIEKGQAHHHVAIYLGVHGGKKYVAEGLSRGGKAIYNATKKVQVTDIATSRMCQDGDTITHFAHCIKTDIEQTPRHLNRIGLASKGSGPVFNIADYPYNPVVGEDQMKHFVLIDNVRYNNDPGKSSLVYSNTAHANNINNNPTPEQRKNLVNLVNYLLDPLYEAVQANGIGKLYVTSGYRNEELNKKVIGSSEHSQHMSGQAVDIKVSECKGSQGNALLKVAQLLLTLERNSGFSYDQMIFEEFSNDADYQALRPKWLHLSFVSKEKNRKYTANSAKIFAYRTGYKNKYLTPEQVLNMPTV